MPRLTVLAQAGGPRARARDAPARGCDWLIVYLFVFWIGFNPNPFLSGEPYKALDEAQDHNHWSEGS